MIVSRAHVPLVIVATAFSAVNGNKIHTITVGAAGRTIEPPFIAAESSDIVTFVFRGDFYTIVQSTYENPLVPLSGGFDSGPARGSIDGSVSVPTWDLRIADSLHPIWFFCKGPQESSNCTEGVVGSINPPNQKMYNIFASAGNQNFCTLAPTATATNSSIFTSTSVQEASSVAPSPTQTSPGGAAGATQSASAAPASRNRHRDAIIGGVIGGVLGLLLILLVAYLCCWRRRRPHSEASRGGDSPFQTYERKVDSTTYKETTPAPSAFLDKQPSSELNADGIAMGIPDSPSLGYLGHQQPQNSPHPHREQGPTNTIFTTGPSEGLGQQTNITNNPIITNSSHDIPDPVLSPGPSKADPLQQSNHAVFMSPLESRKGYEKEDNIARSSPEKPDPMLIKGSTSIEQEQVSPSTYRTPMGARLRQVVKAEEAHPEYGTVIGIDLGTSYSRVGVQRGGTFEIIPNEQGQWATPSWVCFNGKKRLVGDFGRNFDPGNTVFAIKRLIGRKTDDADIIQDMKMFPFKVIRENAVPKIAIMINGRERSFTPEEITATIITRMKDIAEVHLGHKVTHAVVTVPACFNDAQRQATKDAGKIAGLDIVRILNEPTAAAITYGLNRKGVSRILVYDLGGGFFDVSLLSIDNGVFEVLATTGDTRLGGEDFDNRVMDHFVRLYKRKTGTDVSQNFLSLAMLKSVVEKAKRTLSSEHSVEVEISSFENGNDFLETLTRATFEELNIDLLNKTIKLVEQALRDANCRKEEVDEVLLIGGSTHIPKVQQLLKQFFRNKEPSRDIDPESSIVRGAAVQGGILSGTERTADIVLVDVCPHSLGVEIIGGVFSTIIPRNTTIPMKKSKKYTTISDNQTAVEFPVFEGEHTKAKYNNLLGTFTLSGIRPAPRGVPRIRVTFEIDASGIMEARAVDEETGNSKSITVTTNKGRLSREEIIRIRARGSAGED